MEKVRDVIQGARRSQNIGLSRKLKSFYDRARFVAKVNGRALDFKLCDQTEKLVLLHGKAGFARFGISIINFFDSEFNHDYLQRMLK
jgi:hypothetical protein